MPEAGDGILKDMNKKLIIGIAVVIAIAVAYMFFSAQAPQM